MHKMNIAAYSKAIGKSIAHVEKNAYPKLVVALQLKTIVGNLAEVFVNKLYRGESVNNPETEEILGSLNYYLVGLANLCGNDLETLVYEKEARAKILAKVKEDTNGLYRAFQDLDHATQKILRFTCEESQAIPLKLIEKTICIVVAEALSATSLITGALDLEEEDILYKSFKVVKENLPEYFST